MGKNQLDDVMENLGREEIQSALFANLIVQQTNMAFMFLGRVPHPETGQVMKELDSAKFFIDQIEMLEVKTKGNLSKQEEALLKQSLTTLRMAFVEAIEHPESATSIQPDDGETATPEPLVSGGSSVEEEKKKYSKKY